MKAVFNGRLYDTQKAKRIASDEYWDGSNWSRNGRNVYLYKTPNGRYFKHYTTCWQGERDYIEPLSLEEAKELYERLPEHEADYEEAFGVAPEIA